MDSKYLFLSLTNICWWHWNHFLTQIIDGHRCNHFLLSSSFKNPLKSLHSSASIETFSFLCCWSETIRLGWCKLIASHFINVLAVNIVFQTIDESWRSTLDINNIFHQSVILFDSFSITTHLSLVIMNMYLLLFIFYFVFIELLQLLI